MAHKTKAELDELAAFHKEDLPPTEVRESLTYGATGVEADRLVNLLSLLGYHENNHITGHTKAVDETVLADVQDALSAGGGGDQLGSLPALNGVVVTQQVWDALYTLAEDRAPEASAAG